VHVRSNDGRELDLPIIKLIGIDTEFEIERPWGDVIVASGCM
jgi:hypothetical protein